MPLGIWYLAICAKNGFTFVVSTFPMKVNHPFTHFLLKAVAYFCTRTNSFSNIGFCCALAAEDLGEKWYCPLCSQLRALEVSILKKIDTKFAIYDDRLKKHIDVSGLLFFKLCIFLYY